VEIRARRVGVQGAHGPLLRPTSLAVRSGEVVVVSGEPGDGHTALALALSGRMRPTSGAVLLDGRENPRALRRHVAVVDAPGVSAPEDALDLATVVAEELGYAGRRRGHHAVHTWLAERDAASYARQRVESVPADLRTRLLVDLAARRPGVEGLILTCPDRHGGDPHEWWYLAVEQADAGRAVVVLCSNHTADDLDTAVARLGEQQQPPPLVVRAGSEPAGAAEPGSATGSGPTGTSAPGDSTGGPAGSSIGAPTGRSAGGSASRSASRSAGRSAGHATGRRGRSGPRPGRHWTPERSGPAGPHDLFEPPDRDRDARHEPATVVIAPLEIP
jgi:ABC transporter